MFSLAYLYLCALYVHRIKVKIDNMLVQQETVQKHTKLLSFCQLNERNNENKIQSFLSLSLSLSIAYSC